MKDIFSTILKNKKWGQKSLCGPGSTLEYTSNLRKEIPELIKIFKIKSILDLPCGDFSWMSLIKFPKNVNYIGADIVDFMINENRLKYPDKDFRILNLVSDKLPDADLLICRDCLLHLDFKSIDQSFYNISKSNFKYVLISNWFQDYNNFQDIEIGQSRYINLLADPYNFSQPIYSVDDYITRFPERKMLLFAKSDIDNYVARIL